MRGLEPDDRAVVEGLLLAGSWYPVGTWSRVLERYLHALHGDAPEHHARSTAFTTSRQPSSQCSEPLVCSSSS